MAQSPRPRARPGARAINTDTTEAPAIPVYITQAEKWVAANKAKNEQASAEKVAATQVNKAMVAADLSTFEFTVGNTIYDATISSDTTDSVSTAKLYAKIAAGEITMAQFVSMVTATQSAVKDLFGTNMLNSVLDTNVKDAALKIKARK